MIRMERQLAVALEIEGVKYPAGTPIAEFEGKKWFTTMWVDDATRAGFIAKVAVPCDKDGRPVEPVASDAADLIQDDPDGGLESGDMAGELSASADEGESAQSADDEPAAAEVSEEAVEEVVEAAGDASADLALPEVQPQRKRGKK